MKIAIYHNLGKGGALVCLTEIIKCLKNSGHSIDLYCHKNEINNIPLNNVYIYKLKKTTTLLGHLLQIFFELKKYNIQIAHKINNGNYDLVLIGQCILVQTPYLLKFLNTKNSHVYLLNEPKREFYENTSFDHYSIKKILARIIRIPIKFIDRENCKHAKIIITNSQYSAMVIQNIYNKKSFVVYPGLKQVKIKKIRLHNLKNFISVGLLSKIKGHHFSIYQIKKIVDKFTIIGRKTPDFQFIEQISKKNKIILKNICTENNKEKILILKKYSIYLANNEKEPFGITTLEATNNNLFILGKNEAGTAEIVSHGLNGLLYPNKLNIAFNTTKYIYQQSYLNIFQTCKIDWHWSTNKLMRIISVTNV